MYRWVEHTAEVELAIDAADEHEVFADALAGFRELLGEQPEGAAERRTLTIEGADRASLLAEWLEELVYLAETQGFVPAGLVAFARDDGGLRAEVAGAIGTPPHVVKAVTYHRLEFEPHGNRFRARVILDV